MDLQGKNMIMLKDTDTGEADALIFTKASAETIQADIHKARELFDELEETETGAGVCLYDFIAARLRERFGADVLPLWEYGETVYY